MVPDVSVARLELAVSMSASYEESVARELENFRNVANVHDLPEIYHYWSERYVTPLLAEVGVQSIDLFFADHVAQRCARRNGTSVRVVRWGRATARSRCRWREPCWTEVFAMWK